MLYPCPEATCYKGLNSVTIFKLKDNKSQFTNDAGNFCRRTETGEKTPYIPTTQQGDTILHYHHTLGHIRGRNLFKIMKHKVWWPQMRQDILNLPEMCVLCEKYTSKPVPPKSALPIKAIKPFKQARINQDMGVRYCP
ncbi:hypothetical protein DSO57_1038795 [Entomophthora muscae]|uniref:Uncharacterized protein n=1 Tax=Entomophthora muscae TaxID=34485 RepID=A0ACC2RPG4_9FUNG|nr:hypothetical protein DSO57_1038795 [Entomophthora muscae]